VYYPVPRTLYLIDRSGGVLSGAIGSSTVLTNSQCAVNLANSAAWISGYTLSLIVSTVLNSGWAGTTGTVQVASIDGGFSTYSVNYVSGSITIAPLTATLAATQAQQFSATVTGQTSSQVDWSISPQVGSITGAGLYTAPAVIPAATAVTVTATSHANPALTAWSTVTLTTGLPANLNLPTMTLSSGQTDFKATQTITAASGFNVNGSAGVTFTAGSQITIGPCGAVDPCFDAKAGPGGPAKVFDAKIDPNVH
jgi:hypothetical protein